MKQQTQIMIVAVGRWRMLKTGWKIWWRSISGDFGYAYFCGFVAADTVSYLLYSVLKAIALGTWAWLHS